jgi:Flp pilus assembly protein TadD
MPINRCILFCVFFSLAATTLFAGADELQERFAEAQYTFDQTLAKDLLPQYEQLAQSTDSESAWLDYAAAALLVAELIRGDYEHLSVARKQKRELGRSIDRVANSALKALAILPDSSERYRLEADLLGAMIRSKFKGMKYQERLELAIAKALELDENNADAWVSNAKRPLFAAEKHGGEPALALEYLNRALEIRPEHVQALLFRGVAHTKLGESALAEEDWVLAKKLNPNVAGAQERLLDIEV